MKSCELWGASARHFFQCGLRGVDTRIQRKIGFIDCGKKISYIRYAFLIIHCNILQWNISHSSRFYSRQELHWLGISHCIPLPSLIFDGPRNRMQHFTVPKDVKPSLTLKKINSLCGHDFRSPRLNLAWREDFHLLIMVPLDCCQRWQFLSNGPMTIPTLPGGASPKSARTGHLEVQNQCCISGVKMSR